MKKPLLVTDYHGVLPFIINFLSERFDIIIITGSNYEAVGHIKRIINEHNIKVKKIVSIPQKYYQYKREGGYSRFRDEWKIQQIIKLKPDYYIDNEEYAIRQVSKRSPKTICLFVYQDEKWHDNTDLGFRKLLKGDKEALKVINNLV